jgi:hypothetical protein
MNFFMEVAKLRAARLLWHRLMQQQFEPKKPQSLMLRTHCQTSGVASPSRTPTTTSSAPPSRPWPRCSAAPSPAHQLLRRGARPAHRLLRPHRPQHPAGHAGGDRHHPRGRPPRRLLLRRGAHHSLAAEAWALIDEVEELGGMTKAVESGMPKLRIEEAAARRQARIDRGEEVIVGVNKYQPDGRARSTCSTSTTPRCASRRSPPRAGAGRAATSRLRGRAGRPAPRAAAGDPATCWRSRRRRPGPGHRGRDERRPGGRLRPPQGRDPVHPACTASAYEGDDVRRDPGRRSRPSPGRGPPPAHPGGQDGPGRPRPRRQGDRHRLRRPRLRRRHRPAVPDPAEAARTRSRTTCTWSACRPRPPATRPWCPSSSRS